VVGVAREGRVRSPKALEEAAHRNAAATLRLAQCPKCGGRDDALFAAVRSQVFALMGLVAAAVLAVGTGLRSLLRNDPVLYVTALFGLAAAYGVHRRERWRWRSVRRRVAFLPPTVEERPTAPPPPR
jgi:hypothetical protein